MFKKRVHHDFVYLFTLGVVLTCLIFALAFSQFKEEKTRYERETILQVSSMHS